MSEYAFSHPIGRRDFLTRAGIALGGAAVAGIASSTPVPHAPWLSTVPTGDSRIGRLKRLRSAQIAERTFGQLDWSAVRVASLNDGATALNDERMYYVPIHAGRGVSTLLVLSDPWATSRERRR